MVLFFVIYSLQAGGAERVTSNLANYWAEKGWQVTVVTLTGTSDDFYYLHPAVRRIALDVAGKSRGGISAIRSNLARVYRLRRVLRRCQPDVVLAMMNTTNVLLALAGIGISSPLKLGAERIHPPQLPLGRTWTLLRAHAYGLLDAVVALTRESAGWIECHTDAKRVSVVPNAASWPLVKQNPIIPLPAPANDEYRLLAVGRLDTQKGFDILIDAFQQLAADFPQWKLVILGEGPERHALQSQIDVAGLHDRISLPGRAGNMDGWYGAADLFVMSSRFEGFPNTLAEAMAYGLPVVSVDCDTGPRDIIRHEIDGLLVPMNDVDALSTALRRLMGDSSLRAQLAARAVEMRERFSLERIAGLWESLFLTLRSKKNGAADHL